MADHFGHYKVLERVGGGAVEVYRARDMRVGRTVALKVLPGTLAPADRDRLFERALAVSRLSHPNIATLYEVGDDGGPFLVFEFLPGQTLSTLIASGPLNARRAVDLVAQMADGVAEAHAAGITHGDLTTDAVIVTLKGHAKILDFGLTEWTSRLGQATLETAAESRVDIAALGIVLFQLLTGRVSGGGPMTPSAVNGAVPRELDPIVMKALGKHPDRAYDSAAMLAADLRGVAKALDDRASSAPAVHPNPGVRATSPAVWIGLVLLLGALAGAAWWWL